MLIPPGTYPVLTIGIYYYNLVEPYYSCRTHTSLPQVVLNLLVLVVLVVVPVVVLVLLVPATNGHVYN